MAMSYMLVLLLLLAIHALISAAPCLSMACTEKRQRLKLRKLFLDRDFYQLVTPAALSSNIEGLPLGGNRYIG